MEKRSPIKDIPLRHAGESLDQKITHMRDDILYKYGIYAAGFAAIVVYEWMRYLTNSPSNPTMIAVVAVFVIGYSLHKVIQMKKEIELRKLGRDGERAVGEELEKLRSKGYAVFHDIIGDDFNLDHVVLSPKGIYTVETKTLSKPIKGDVRVTFDGEQNLVNGMRSDREPIVQSKLQAKWLGDVLSMSTGKHNFIKSVILYPGWFVETTNEGRGSPIWVLNPKAFPAFIENEKERISEPDLHLASFHLARYTRSTPAI